MYWYDDGANGWGRAVMALNMPLYRWLHRDGPAGEGQPRLATFTARRLLAERYPRGEIDDQEYHRRLFALGSH